MTDKIDYENPAFDSYDKRFREDVKRYGFEEVYLGWAAGQACGCMGPQNSEPLCPCAMHSAIAAKYGKIVQIKPCEDD